MKRRLASLLPALAMGLGSLLLLRVNRQETMHLRAPLSGLPSEILGYQGTDRMITPEEQAVAGMSNYLLRQFGNDSTMAFSLYVGYYERQTEGRTIHSPRNCLPGAGWEPVGVSNREIVAGPHGVRVRRYVLAKGTSRALVYYWYQGRGRVSSNEYWVKWELLRDAALAGRTEEALVRLVLPLDGAEAAADSIATSVARTIIPAIDRVLPAFPNRTLSPAAFSLNR